MLDYDIHIGTVWSFSGKLLALFTSSISASLPITGFMLWWNQKKNKAERNNSKKPQSGKI